eukprot:COSAG02_NODE_8121_length_2699_cov_12.634739_2_plen_124_part_00
MQSFGLIECIMDIYSYEVSYSKYEFLGPDSAAFRGVRSSSFRARGVMQQLMKTGHRRAFETTNARGVAIRGWVGGSSDEQPLLARGSQAPVDTVKNTPCDREHQPSASLLVPHRHTGTGTCYY